MTKAGGGGTGISDIVLQKSKCRVDGRIPNWVTMDFPLRIGRQYGFSFDDWFLSFPITRLFFTYPIYHRSL